MRQLTLYVRKPAFWITLVAYMLVAFWLLSTYCFGGRGVMENNLFCPVGVALVANAFAGAVLIGPHHRSVASALAIAFVLLLVVYIIALVI